MDLQSFSIFLLLMEKTPDFIIKVATAEHSYFSELICTEMEASAKARGTGIAKRSPDYVSQKMLEGKAVIATTTEGVWAGFCYIETWGHGEYVANSGLIVAPEFRKSGLAKKIKEKVFDLSRKKYPNAKIFGLTTGLAVMKINSELGYKPVTYSELTNDEEFWKGCRSCVNFEILTNKERKNCLCTAMLYDPEKEEKKSKQQANLWDFARESNLYERWMDFKKRIMLSQEEKRTRKANVKGNKRRTSNFSYLF